MTALHLSRRRIAQLAGTSAMLALTALALPAFAADEADLFTRSLQTYGWVAALPAAFAVGLATAATPCVYPMIAITVSVFGARRESRSRAALLSTAFVAGIAAMFVPLGLAAGLSGTVAGALAGNPYVVAFEAILMFAMAASMFGLFDISLPGSVQNRLASMGGTGPGGAFLIGLATGPIAAPCATAGLVGILDFVFRTQNAAAGAIALTAYSLGLGLPFWLVGTFAVGLPKPGGWMNHVKNGLGLVLAVMGAWYLRRLVPWIAHPPTFMPQLPWLFLAIALAGVAIGSVHLSLKEGTGIERARKIIGISLSVLGGLWWLSYEPQAQSGACTPITWHRNPQVALETARREHRPVLLDFGATWCPACEELAHQTFPTQEVACVADRLHYIPVKIYEDQERPANYDELSRQYRIRGLPTVIVLDPNGQEIARETRFVPPAQMAALMRRVDQRHSSR